mgnify:CR=1 FL=1
MENKGYKDTHYTKEVYEGWKERTERDLSKPPKASNSFESLCGKPIEEDGSTYAKLPTDCWLNEYYKYIDITYRGRVVADGYKQTILSGPNQPTIVINIDEFMEDKRIDLILKVLKNNLDYYKLTTHIDGSIANETFYLRIVQDPDIGDALGTYQPEPEVTLMMPGIRAGHLSLSEDLDDIDKDDEAQQIWISSTSYISCLTHECWHFIDDLYKATGLRSTQVPNHSTHSVIDNDIVKEMLVFWENKMGDGKLPSSKEIIRELLPEMQEIWLRYVYLPPEEFVHLKMAEQLDLEPKTLTSLSITHGVHRTLMSYITGVQNVAKGTGGQKLVNNSTMRRIAESILSQVDVSMRKGFKKDLKKHYKIGL